MSDVLVIGRYPSPIVNLVCNRCGRRGRYRRATLVARFGADTSVPNVAAAIERESGCPRAGQYGGCFVTFEELRRRPSPDGDPGIQLLSSADPVN